MHLVLIALLFLSAYPIVAPPPGPEVTLTGVVRACYVDRHCQYVAFDTGPDTRRCPASIFVHWHGRVTELRTYVYDSTFPAGVGDTISCRADSATHWIRNINSIRPYHGPPKLPR